eukprot:364409-Chlamydomonas_euryale.AAC.4
MEAPFQSVDAAWHPQSRGSSAVWGRIPPPEGQATLPKRFQLRPLSLWQSKLWLRECLRSEQVLKHRPARCPSGRARRER